VREYFFVVLYFGDEWDDEWLVVVGLYIIIFIMAVLVPSLQVAFRE